MTEEIELVSDGDGLAITGNPGAVERFIEAFGLSPAEMESPRLKAALGTGAGVVQAGSELAANSSRWIKLTSESAQKMSDVGLTPTTTKGVSHAMLGERGAIKSWLQVETGAGSMLTNPATLSGVAGVMSQMAMQQAINEITDYLAVIDQKLDDVLRSQTNQVLARMDGVDLAIKEATSVRDSVGRVSEITWSKVQTSSGTILETQGYALRQLGDLADKLERKTKVDELVKTAREAETDVQKWLAVLARCFQLHDAVAVLELDRVQDASPDELDRHRIGLKAAREDRLVLIRECTERLLTRMDAAASTANSKVLFNPIQSPAVVRASNSVGVEVHEFHGLLGIESGPQSSDARRWREAASEGLERARETSSDGLGAVKNFGSGTRDQAKSVKGKLSGRLAERKLRRSGDD